MFPLDPQNTATEERMDLIHCAMSEDAAERQGF